MLAGVNLFGLIRLPISTDNYVKSSIRRHSTTLAGLFVLGMIFSIVKAPCAAPMILVLLSRILIDGTVQDLSLLLIFGAGVLTPFLGVGVRRGIRLVKQDTGIQGHHSSGKRDSVDRIRALDALLGVNAAGSADTHPLDRLAYLARPSLPREYSFSCTCVILDETECLVFANSRWTCKEKGQKT